MSGALRILPAVIVVLSASFAFASPEEDLAFAEGLFKRKWYDWAEETVVKVIKYSNAPVALRGWAAQLHRTSSRRWRERPATTLTAGSSKSSKNSTKR